MLVTRVAGLSSDLRQSVRFGGSDSRTAASLLSLGAWPHSRVYGPSLRFRLGRTRQRRDESRSLSRGEKADGQLGG